MSVLKSICEDLNIPSITSKVSYGGGYSVPKHTSTLPPPVQIKPLTTINQAGSRDLITSIDRELTKMRSDSNRVAEFRVKYEETLPKQDLTSLEEIGKLRLIHQEKLKVLESEYSRVKVEKNGQQQPKKQNYLREDPFIVHVQRNEIEEIDERETLLRWLFGKLDIEGSGLINKQDMVSEIESNEQLSKYFQIQSEDIDRLLPSDFISQNDFLQFFLSVKPSKPKSVPVKKQVKFENQQVSSEYPAIVLKTQHLKIIENIYKEVDIHNDMAIQKFEFLQSLRTDDDIIKMLDLDAIEISKGNFVTLETVLDNLQDSEDLYDYITYSQFLDLILNMYPKQTWVPEKNEKKVLLDSLYQQILLDVFDGLPRKGKGLVSNNLLIKTLREDPQVMQFGKDEIRDGITFEGILRLIERDAGELVSWEDFLMYFSEDGKPEVRIQDGNVNRSNFYALKEDFTKLDKNSPNDPIKPFNYQYVDTMKSKKRSKSKPTLKFTVPVPFAFDSREQHKSKSIKQQKFEKYINEMKQQEENHLKYRPSPIPVPAEVIVPKYNTLIAAQEQRRNEVKQNSKKLTKEREKPFGFYIREMNKPKVEETGEAIYRFKAKPPPASNSIPLYEQMSRKIEEDRKIRIEAAAKKALEESKLPPRMEKYGKEKKILDIPVLGGSLFKAKKPPEFEKLWENLGKSLNQKKDSFQPTVIKEFKITEGKTKSKQEPDIDEELAKKGFLQITKKASEVKEMDPTKKQSENDESGKKRREELQKADEEKRKKKEERDILEELQKKRLEEKKKKEREKIMQGVKDRPPIVDAISSEYSKINSGTRVLTTIKQKMQKMGIKSGDIIGETDNFIDVIAEDLV